jgi:hypothetical protein
MFGFLVTVYNFGNTVKSPFTSLWKRGAGKDLRKSFSIAKVL